MAHVTVYLNGPLDTDQLGFDPTSLILGGALGNVADRVLRGQVVDFLDFHWRLAHWPAFNLADSAIVIGAIALIATTFIGKGPATTSEETSP